MAAVADARDLAAERLRTFLPSIEERKGFWLSHLFGFALFNEFALNFIKLSLPYFPVTSIPIRAAAVWLMLDRTGRIGRLRMAMWDYIILGFVVLTAIGCVYTSATNAAVQPTSEDFKRFASTFFNYYIYYVVAKEALNRRGFRPDIAIKWLLAGLAWSALVGVMQALNLFGARSWSLIYANSNLTWIRDASDTTSDVGVGYASGTAPWWNSMALEMLVAFALAFGPTFIRKPKPYEWALGALFMGAFIATQSRGGLIAFGACGIATFFWYVVHRKYGMAMTIGVVFTTGVALWVFAVFALKIEKFTSTLGGEKVRGSQYSDSIEGRFVAQKKLFEIGMRQPIFGVGPTFGRATLSTWSPYTVRAADTTYGIMFAEFGLVGLIFIAMIVGYGCGFIRRDLAYRPYAFAAFFIAVAFAVHGYVEFLLYSRTFLVMNVLAAFAGSPYLVTEEGRAGFKRVVKGVWDRTPAEV